MFPLGTVLFPGAVLPLHVFEPRYRKMTKDCLERDRVFGVVLIERGSEVGGGDQRFSVGTTAEIVEAIEGRDGRWALATVGTTRLSVVRWIGEEPYPRAEVVELADDGDLGASDLALLDEAARAVRRALALKAELGERAAPFTVEVATQPELAGWHLAALAPIGDLDKQRLLEQMSPAERLRQLRTLVEAESSVLARRLGGG